MHYLRGFGGDTSNMAIAAARLLAGTGRVGYATRVGDDAFGRMLLELWRREGVDTRGVASDPAAPTGVYFVTHGAHGHDSRTCARVPPRRGCVPRRCRTT